MLPHGCWKWQLLSILCLTRVDDSPVSCLAWRILCIHWICTWNLQPLSLVWFCSSPCICLELSSRCWLWSCVVQAGRLVFYQIVVLVGQVVNTMSLVNLGELLQICLPWCIGPATHLVVSANSMLLVSASVLWELPLVLCWTWQRFIFPVLCLWSCRYLWRHGWISLLFLRSELVQWCSQRLLWRSGYSLEFSGH